MRRRTNGARIDSSLIFVDESEVHDQPVKGEPMKLLETENVSQPGSCGMVAIRELQSKECMFQSWSFVIKSGTRASPTFRARTGYPRRYANIRTGMPKRTMEPHIFKEYLSNADLRKEPCRGLCGGSPSKIKLHEILTSTMTATSRSELPERKKKNRLMEARTCAYIRNHGQK